MLAEHGVDPLKTDVGHIMQSIFLIASNAAAILPGYWALRQKVLILSFLFECSSFPPIGKMGLFVVISLWAMASSF